MWCGQPHIQVLGVWQRECLVPQSSFCAVETTTAGHHLGQCVMEGMFLVFSLFRTFSLCIQSKAKASKNQQQPHTQALVILIGRLYVKTHPTVICNVIEIHTHSANYTVPGTLLATPPAPVNRGQWQWPPTIFYRPTLLVTALLFSHKHTRYIIYEQVSTSQCFVRQGL